MDKEKIAVFWVEDADNYKAHLLHMKWKLYQLAKEKEAEVIFCYIGSNDPDFFEQAGQCGANKIVLFMAEKCGKRVAAILSTRLECGLIADYIDVTYSDDNIIFFSRNLEWCRGCKN